MLWRFRILAFYSFISILTISFFTFFCIPLKLLNVKSHIKLKAGRIFCYIFIFAAKFICGLNYKITGLEKLPKEPFLLLSNHQSFWENVIMQLILTKYSWVIKRELLDIPFFGWGLKVMDPIAIDRSNTSSVSQIINGGKQKFREGISLVIFPEGTRLRPEQKVKFKPSAAKLALVAKVPIVLMVHNAGLFWPKGFWLTKPGMIDVKIIDIMQPEDIEKFDARTLTDHIEMRINQEKEKLLA